MQTGTLYYKLDCLDVLETLEDKSISLIYFDLPYEIGKKSERYLSNDNEILQIAKVIGKGKKKLQELTPEEARVYAYECEHKKKRDYEKYILKIVENCYRVLKDDGIVVYMEDTISLNPVDTALLLKSRFYKVASKVIDGLRSPHGCGEDGFSSYGELLHFFSKNKHTRLPRMSELQPVDKEWDKEQCYYLWNGYQPTYPWSFTKCYFDYDIVYLFNKRYLLTEYDFHNSNIQNKEEYTRVRQIPVSSSWKARELWPRIFGNGVLSKKGDKVLCLHEQMYFAYFAELFHLSWHSVLVNGFGSIHDYLKVEMYKKYTIVESLVDHQKKKYNNKLPLLVDFERKRTEELFSFTNYGLLKSLTVGNGDTVDEILHHAIEEYLIREQLTLSELEKNTGILRETFYELEDIMRGKRKSKDRKKFLILRIAIFTEMNYQEMIRALTIAEKSFDYRNNAADRAIFEWFCGHIKSIDDLNEKIHTYCTEDGWEQKKINERLLQTPIGKSKKVKVFKAEKEE